jgi:hypothetical protein
LHNIHLIAMITTIVVESMGMAGVVARWPHTRSARVSPVLIAAGLNLVTHTVFWYALPLSPLPSTIALYSYELLVVIVEAVAYARWCGFTFWQAGLLSLGLNVASYLSGGLIWPYVLA